MLSHLQWEGDSPRASRGVAYSGDLRRMSSNTFWSSPESPQVDFHRAWTLGSIFGHFFNAIKHDLNGSFFQKKLGLNSQCVY